MASGRDVRDMLGLPAGGEVATAAAKKRAKPSGAVRKIRTSDIYDTLHKELQRELEECLANIM